MFDMHRTQHAEMQDVIEFDISIYAQGLRLICSVYDMSGWYGAPVNQSFSTTTVVFSKASLEVWSLLPIFVVDG